MPFKVTKIQPTPNPNAVKVILDGAISDDSISFLSAEQAQEHPVARRLFAIAGVSSLLFLGDFITVNKNAAAGWPPIKRAVREVLASI